MFNSVRNIYNKKYGLIGLDIPIAWSKRRLNTFKNQKKNAGSLTKDKNSERKSLEII